MSATPLWLPPAIQRERDNQVPSGELELSDGRKLKPSHGQLPFDLWRAPDGLSVMAEVKPTARHGALLHVVVAYAARRPSWNDVRRVREVFFGKRDVFIPFGVDDDAQDNMVHLWAMPKTWSK